MVIFSVLIVLASLLQPSLKKLISTSLTHQCQLQLKQIFTAISLYNQDHDNFYPGPSFTSQSPVYYNPEKENYSDNTARYLYPYLDTGTNAYGNLYVKQYICPQNANMDLKSVPEARTQYRATNISGVGKPFGYPLRSWSNPKDPLSIYKVKIPSKSTLMTDADRKNCGWIDKGYAPEEPSHDNFSRNYLYADGNIELREIY